MLIPLTREFYQLNGEIFLHKSQGGCLCASDPRGSPSMILHFTRNLVDGLNSRGSFLSDF